MKTDQPETKRLIDNFKTIKKNVSIIISQTYNINKIIMMQE